MFQKIKKRELKSKSEFPKIEKQPPKYLKT